MFFLFFFSLEDKLKSPKKLIIENGISKKSNSMNIKDYCLNKFSANN